MFGSKIANPYSEALLQLGLNLYLKEENADTQVFFQIIFDMENLLTILKLTPVLEKYLANPLILDKDKKNVLETMCLPSTIYFFFCYEKITNVDLYTLRVENKIGKQKEIHPI